jgi:predicted lipoprotein with Yx(FWY)xxD motif
MKRWLALATLMVTLSFAAGCGDDGYSGDSTTPAADTSTRAAQEDTAPARQARKRRTTTVKVMNTDFGRILVDGKGRALYLFTKEPSSKSRCYGQCAVAWPPFYARGNLRAGRGADADEIGSTRRRDGRRIVTYNGHPLYYYVTDRKPGQVTCHNVVEFGGTWLVVNPKGNAVS